MGFGSTGKLPGLRPGQISESPARTDARVMAKLKVTGVSQRAASRTFASANLRDVGRGKMPDRINQIQALVACWSNPDDLRKRMGRAAGHHVTELHHRYRKVADTEDGGGVGSSWQPRWCLRGVGRTAFATECQGPASGDRRPACLGFGSGGSRPCFLAGPS